MGKIIIKYGILLGVLLAVSNTLESMLHFSPNGYEQLIVGLIISGGVAFLAIRSFLKIKENAIEYSFLHGMCISFFIFLFSIPFNFELTKIYSKYFGVEQSEIPLQGVLGTFNIPLIIFLTFVVPLLFVFQRKFKRENIIDEDI